MADRCSEIKASTKEALACGTLLDYMKPLGFADSVRCVCCVASLLQEDAAKAMGAKNNPDAGLVEAGDIFDEVFNGLCDTLASREIDKSVRYLLLRLLVLMNEEKMFGGLTYKRGNFVKGILTKDQNELASLLQNEIDNADNDVSEAYRIYLIKSTSLHKIFDGIEDFIAELMKDPPEDYVNKFKGRK